MVYSLSLYSNDKDMTMFEIILPHDLGVLAVQHEGVLDGTMMDVGQGPGGGSIPPQKLTIGLPTTSLEVGQGPDGGPIPPPK